MGSSKTIVMRPKLLAFMVKNMVVSQDPSTQDMISTTAYGISRISYRCVVDCKRIALKQITTIRVDLFYKTSMEYINEMHIIEAAFHLETSGNLLLTFNCRVPKVGVA
jgi:hypothetical protein